MNVEDQYQEDFIKCGESESEEEEEEEEDDGKGPPKMFVMNLVNSYGNAQLEELRNDGQPIKIGESSVIS